MGASSEAQPGHGRDPDARRSSWLIASSVAVPAADATVEAGLGRSLGRPQSWLTQARAGGVAVGGQLASAGQEARRATLARTPSGPAALPGEERRRWALPRRSAVLGLLLRFPNLSSVSLLLSPPLLPPPSPLQPAQHAPRCPPSLLLAPPCGVARPWCVLIFPRAIQAARPGRLLGDELTGRPCLIVRTLDLGEARGPRQVHLPRHVAHHDRGWHRVVEEEGGRDLHCWRRPSRDCELLLPSLSRSMGRKARWLRPRQRRRRPSCWPESFGRA